MDQTYQADANIGRGTNDMGSITGAGLIVGVGGILFGLELELVVGEV